MKYAPYKLKSASSSTPDESKRRFLSALVVVSGAAATLTAQKATKLLRKKDVRRKTPIVPPGSLSIKNLQQKCISCHLCVSKCPSHVIKPAYNEYGAAGFMQPVLYFEKGFCNYDCTVCGEVCPTGSITALTKEEKHHTQMGKVVFVHDNCIVPNYESNCGACSEHCPTQAVYMVPYKDDLTIPATNTEICVGCGGCEYVCPAKPYKAIYVEGLAQHNKITIHKEEKEEIKIDDFGF